MTEPEHPRRALVLSDGAAGNENQALALASALTSQVETMRLESRAPWRWCAPHRLPGATHAFGTAFAARLHAPWPDVVVGCGRQAALATRLMREASAGACTGRSTHDADREQRRGAERVQRARQSRAQR